MIVSAILVNCDDAFDAGDAVTLRAAGRLDADDAHCGQPPIGMLTRAVPPLPSWMVWPQ